MNNENSCCPKFNPELWDEKEIAWENKKFVTDRVCSFLHIPMNFGSVMKRIMNKVEASNVNRLRVLSTRSIGCFKSHHALKKTCAMKDKKKEGGAKRMKTSEFGQGSFEKY